MNTDEFKILRKNLNISCSKLARLTGEETDKVTHFFKNDGGTLPTVSQCLTKLHQVIEQHCKVAVEDIEQMHTSNEEIILIKYNSDKDFLFADPDLFALLLCFEAHTALLKKISQGCNKKSIKIEIINFRKEKYTNWLKEKGYCNCSKHRAEWISSARHFPLPFNQLEFRDKLTVDAKKAIKRMQKIIPSSIPLNSKYNITTKIDVFRNALLHNILDLASDAIIDYKKNKLIKSAAVTRALFEREAILYCLYKLVNEAVKSNSPIDNTKLNKLMAGSRGEFREIDCINILTAIEKQIKDVFPDTPVQHFYDELSNIVHPNYNGVMDVYAIIDPRSEQIVFDCHDKGNIGLTIASGVAKSVCSAELWYKGLGEQLIEYKKMKLSTSTQEIDTTIS